ncbi:MAG: TerD family protein [Campylobacterota bacterium]|nr:TerD family protein [Campylobacterota bacterium]
MAVSLVKGQKISLEKSDGSKLNNFCVGANWGAIATKGFFGGDKKKAVDLDLSIGLFDANKNLANIVYFGRLEDSGIKHSGDDRTGDVDGDDGLDNEVISINLSQISSNVEQIVFVLNSYEGDDFATIPFASIRLYEGTPSSVSSVVAKFDIASDSKFSGHVSMILGKLYRRNGEWKFSAIGEPTTDKKLEQTLESVKNKFL